jgi:serine phosphatase RsbU (regulator of sigma subunit)
MNYQKAKVPDKEYLKKVVERQKKALNESLEYAQYIQKALMPKKEKVNDLFPDNFVYFLPRDLVSGDFFWVRQLREKSILAVGDCTGHGVPGAFMSILGITFLNEITNHEPLLSANRILNSMRERIMKTLDQTGKKFELKDGMDLALIIFDQKTNILQFAGAKNPLYHFHNGVLNEIRGDRMPIGVYALFESSFTNHQIHMQEGDRIYLFTDGYVDQLGGPNFKKFKFQSFRSLLSDIQSYNLTEQKELLDKEFNKWKGEFEQVDDILIIGIGF